MNIRIEMLVFEYRRLGFIGSYLASWLLGTSKSWDILKYRKALFGCVVDWASRPCRVQLMD